MSKKHQTPLLDELEKGPFPSFVTEIKKAAARAIWLLMNSDSSKSLTGTGAVTGSMAVSLVPWVWFRRHRQIFIPS